MSKQYSHKLLIALFCSGLVCVSLSVEPGASIQYHDFTITYLICDADRLLAGAATTCSAKVSNASGGPAPTGEVYFSRGGDGTGLFEDAIDTAKCALIPTSPSTSECDVSYQVDRASANPPERGEHLIIATYDGNERFAPSSASESLIASFRASRIELSCSDYSLVVGQETDCTTRVYRDRNESAPLIFGMINFYFAEGQSSLSCELESTEKISTCTISIMPTFAGTDLSLRAVFGGDDHYLNSSIKRHFSIEPRKTMVTLDCNEVLDGKTICRALVGDLSPGTPRAPEGLIHLSGADASNLACSLEELNSRQSACEIELEAPIKNATTLRALYQDKIAVHASSESTFELAATELNTQRHPEYERATDRDSEGSTETSASSEARCNAPNCASDVAPDLLLISLLLFIPLAYRMFRVTMSL